MPGVWRSLRDAFAVSARAPAAEARKIRRRAAAARALRMLVILQSVVPEALALGPTYRREALDLDRPIKEADIHQRLPLRARIAFRSPTLIDAGCRTR
jgi:hypothetical protein